MANGSDELTEEERDNYRKHGGRLVEKREDVEVWDFGNHDDEESEGEEGPHASIDAFSEAHPELLGQGQGQVRLLYQAAARVMGQLDIGPQEWRDCVSWGVGGAIDLRACVEVDGGEGERYSWEDRVCTEALQALSANEFNSGQGWTNSRLGTVAARDGGTLSRRVLGAYSAQRAERWAARGLPDEHEPDARVHRVRDVSRVADFGEARDAIFAGYAVAVGSRQAFIRSGRRDEHGFATPSTAVEWKHCMKFIGMREDERPGLLCMNSWSANSGPKGKYADIPDGSFWVDTSTCDRMLARKGGFAIGGFEGYPRG